MHSTNYTSTLIEVAPDTKAVKGEVPPIRAEKKTIANLEYELISTNPYKFTSDEVKFAVHAIRKKIPKAKHKAEMKAYFSKGQPCFRASPLTKSYGWGVHCDAQGKIALAGCESAEYRQLQKNQSVVKVLAMRSGRK